MIWCTTTAAAATAEYLASWRSCSRRSRESSIYAASSTIAASSSICTGSAISAGRAWQS